MTIEPTVSDAEVEAAAEILKLYKRLALTADARRRAIPETEAVAVKPLEWEHFDSHNMAYATVASLWIAYRVALRTDGRKVVRVEMLGDKNGDLGTYRSWEEAKHAAQTDFETRIRSALTHREGFKPVPIEPTPEMYGAGGVEMFKCDLAAVEPREATGRIYRAMIAASPKE